MLVAAVSMVRARRLTAIFSADLILGAIASAGPLSVDPGGEAAPSSDRNHRQHSPQERPAMTESGQPPREDIELARIHRLP
jgi:hypothetical protein